MTTDNDAPRETSEEYAGQSRASGYTYEGKPVGEDIINRVTELLLPLQTHFRLFQNDQERRFDYMLGQISLAIKAKEASTDALANEIKAAAGELRSVAPVLQEVRGDVADIKKNWHDMGVWQAEVDAWRGRQDEQREAEHERQETRHVEIIARFEHDEARLDKKRIELDGIHQEIDEIRAYIAANRRAELDELKQRVIALEQQLSDRGHR
jgi:DNA repair exonuclease SbcCD ATPase subunit